MEQEVPEITHPNKHNTMRTIWRTILSQNELNTTWMTLLQPRLSRENHTDLVRKPHYWRVIKKRRGISQAWRSYPRSKGLRPHTGHPSVGSSTRKWAPLPGLKTTEASVQCSSVAQLCPTLRSHESQHARPPCPSKTPGVHSDSCPSSQWCHPAISSSVIPFSSCPQFLPA